ncbi:MAG: hypothetical protein ABSD75_27410 [Terriglobales bacterium]
MAVNLAKDGSQFKLDIEDRLAAILPASAEGDSSLAFMANRK